MSILQISHFLDWGFGLLPFTEFENFNQNGTIKNSWGKEKTNTYFLCRLFSYLLSHTHTQKKGVGGEEVHAAIVLITSIHECLPRQDMLSS